MDLRKSRISTGEGMTGVDNMKAVFCHRMQCTGQAGSVNVTFPLKIT